MANRVISLGSKLTSEERTYKLSQTWSSLEDRCTYYLATEDGKLVRPDETCLEFWKYTDNPVRALMIVKKESRPYVFDVLFCRKCRKVRLAIENARVPYRTIEALN